MRPRVGAALLVLSACASTTSAPPSSPSATSVAAAKTKRARLHWPEAPAPPPAPKAAEPEPAGPITLVAVGDVMLARTIGERLAASPPQDPFEHVAEALRGADVAVANLECTAGARGEPAKKAFTFRAPASSIDVLAAAGIDVVGLANNHALDFGPGALDETLELLDRAHVAHAGAGRSEAQAHSAARLRVRGKTLAFLAYVRVPVEGLLPGGFDTRSWEARGDAPGIAWAEPARIANDVAAARASGADVVIVMLHAGYEGATAPTPWQIEAAHAAIDGGARLVLGAHPHVLQGATRYKDGFIAYSLGNFVFDGTDMVSAILKLTIAEDGSIAEVGWTPVAIKAGVPRPTDEPTGAYVKSMLALMSSTL